MYKAIKSFSGIVSMKKGDEKDLKDDFIINDLLNAGYIEKVKEEIKEEIKKVETKIKEEVKEVETEVKSQVKTRKKKSK